MREQGRSACRRASTNLRLTPAFRPDGQHSHSPLLLDELASLPAKGKDLVFPDQVAMYEENPDGITWRVKKVLAVALGGFEA